jgi:hypothetical protein
LVTGTNYVFVIDGSSAAVSDFYVEVTGSSQPCSLLLPVDLIYFNGENKDNSNILNWATSSEFDNHKFELEKSIDGIYFKTIATLNSKSIKGKSDYQLVYQYKVVSDKAYYRLKQIDINGSFRYHKIIFIDEEEKKHSPSVMPNPATNRLTITYISKTNQQAIISLYDVSGREILFEQAVFNDANHEYVLNIESLNRGLYFLTINAGTKTYQHKIIKE